MVPVKLVPRSAVASAVKRDFYSGLVAENTKVNPSFLVLLWY